MTEPALATIRSATWPICRMVRAQPRRARRTVGVAQPRHLGDVAGQVAHPLEVGAHPHGRDDDPQVGGDRLLAGQQVDRAGRRARCAGRRSRSSAAMTASARWMSASSRAVVARFIAEPASRVISTSWSVIVSRSSWKASRMVPFVSVWSRPRRARGPHEARTPGVNGPGRPGEQLGSTCADGGHVVRGTLPRLRTLSVVDATAAATLVASSACSSVRPRRGRACACSERLASARSPSPTPARPAARRRPTSSPSCAPAASSSTRPTGSSRPARPRSPTAWCATHELAHAELLHLARQVRARRGDPRGRARRWPAGPARPASVTVAARVAPLGSDARAGPGRRPHRGPPASTRSAATSSPTSATSSRPRSVALSLLAEAVLDAHDDPEAVAAVRQADAGRERAADRAGAGDHRPVPAAGRRRRCTTPSSSTSTRSSPRRSTGRRLVAEASDIDRRWPSR